MPNHVHLIVIPGKEDALVWNWSSAKAHISKQGSIIPSIIPLADVSRLIDIKDWKEYLTQPDERHTLDCMKKYTAMGRPLGSEDFIKNLERIFNKRLVALPRGRPRKAGK